jgi:hypothetical protein
MVKNDAKSGPDFLPQKLEPRTVQKRSQTGRKGSKTSVDRSAAVRNRAKTSVDRSQNHRKMAKT